MKQHINLLGADENKFDAFFVHVRYILISIYKKKKHFVSLQIQIFETNKKELMFGLPN